MPILDPPREESPQVAAPKNDCTSMHVSLGQDTNPLSISYLARLRRRQLRTIVAITLTVGILFTTFSLTRETRFTATTLLVVDRSSFESDSVSQDRLLPQHVDTEVELLRSINIVKRLADRLSLETDSERLAPALSAIHGIESIVEPVLNVAREAVGAAQKSAVAKMTERVATAFGFGPESHGPALATAIAKGAESKGNSPDTVRSAQLFALAGKFRIRRRGLTDIIAIDASAKTPERAAKLANLYAEVYLEEQVTAKLRSIERVESALALRVDELKAELAQAGAPITLRRLYSDYLSHLREIRQKRSVIMPDLRIAAPALPLEQPSFPSRRLLLLLGVLLALGLAVGVAFVRDRHFFLTARS